MSAAAGAVGGGGSGEYKSSSSSSVASGPTTFGAVHIGSGSGFAAIPGIAWLGIGLVAVLVLIRILKK